MENRAGGVRGTVLAWGVGGVIFVALVWGLATFFKVRLLDFEHYLEAAKLIGQGQNPYGVVEFFAPPWFAWGMWPFLVLPENYAVAVWVLLNLGAVSAATFLAIEWVQVSRPRMRLFLVGLTPIFLPGALFSYITGQVSPLVNLALLGAAWGVANGGTTGWIVGGLLFATVKPHLVLFPALLIGLELLKTRQWRVLLWTGGLLLGLIFVAFLLQPDWFMQMMGALSSGDFRGGQAGLVSTGYVGLRELGVSGWVFAPFGVYVLYRWVKDGLTPAGFSLAIVVNFLLIPYSRSYDDVLLILPLVALAKGQKRADWGVFLLGAGSVFGLPFTNFSMLTPVVLAIACLLKPLNTDK